MRVLILGSKGQTGLALTMLAKSRGCEVLGLDREEIEIAAQEEVDRAVDAFEPTHIINAAAYNAVDAAEEHSDEAFVTNGFGPGCIALAARRHGAVVVHYSTDYVFDGKKGSDYVEEDPPSPLSVYARSKLLGEGAVLSTHDRSYVIRTSWVFGPGGVNFVSRVMKLAREKPELSFVDDSFCQPTYAPDLARVTFELVDRGAPFGLYHAAGAEVMTPYSWAAASLAQAKVGTPVRAVKSASFETKAKRPVRPVLSTAKLAALGITIPGGTSRLADYFAGRIER
ncbi:MAG TPA: dTDP-4-dehydrorhamnose reductase [bacterium]|nr:dTDP-4-dehydrorhamnose reductase [bacterium]